MLLRRSPGSAISVVCLLLAVVQPAPALAGEESFSGELFMTVPEAHAMPIDEADDRAYVLGRIIGLFTRSTGQVGTLRGVELLDEGGPNDTFHGVLVFKFDDGSTLVGSFEGHQDGVDYQARIRLENGTGRFAGASGSGTIEGRNYDAVAGSRASLTATLTTP